MNKRTLQKIKKNLIKIRENEESNMTMNSSDVILGWTPISHLRQIEIDISEFGLDIAKTLLKKIVCLKNIQYTVAI